MKRKNDLGNLLIKIKKYTLPLKALLEEGLKVATHSTIRLLTRTPVI